MMRRFAGVVIFTLTTARLAAGEPAIPPDAGLPVIDWKDAGKHIDQEAIVQGTIVATRNIGRICFLNFDEARSFTAVVRQEHYKKFTSSPEDMYRDKTVRVRGIIGEYRGNAQIEVHSPDQITEIAADTPIPAPPKNKPRGFNGTVTIATFNVLNLFDASDDPYTYDESTPAKPREELDLVAAALRKLDADVVALEEVENRGYLERFVAAKLGDMGYEHVVCQEGNDSRGIDCALLSRFPVGSVTSYRHLRFADDKGVPVRFQRDFLQVEILPPGGPSIYVFPVHFKSKRGGQDETERVRLAETTQARKILDGWLKHDPAALFVVLGDFNDTRDSKSLKAIRGSGAGELRGFWDDLPKDTGTYNEGEHRDMIDFILASPAMAKRYEAKSYRVVPGDKSSLGSDHSPVVCRFRLK